MPFRRKRIVRRSRSFRVPKRGSLFFLALVIFMGFMIQILWMIESNLHPILLVIAKSKVKNIAQEAVTKGIHDLERSLGDELKQTMTVQKDPEGRITFVQIDSKVQAQIYRHISSRLTQEFKHLEDHPVEVPLGQILESNIFAHSGPDIPIQLWPKGAAKVSIIPKMESHGINTVMVALTVRIHNEMGLVVPFTEKTFSIDYEYPVAYAVVVGEVPEYYFYNDQGDIKKGQVQTLMPPPPVPASPPTKK
ncbi:sporulation protein YunB [Paenactinomyces guangxiensis]|uniref:Sporulation protein YunB n=1 Tax=Paenactinomyces guangxiensis TaxID=1490290 RepID=A0A7W1WPI6_9BACL|nr:sporulation protein YunB [Paenactinomyces guangxiensis]MBA4493687.1 sporulation protein YunB [Paenactinomyces guangxiensis]MBH8590974.1 sporulation protein YunB [Paenactinomyces guangxiensis]